MAVKKERLLLSLTIRDKDILRKTAEYHDVSMSRVIRVLIRREAKARGITKERKIAVRRSISRSVVNRRVK